MVSSLIHRKRKNIDQSMFVRQLSQLHLFRSATIHNGCNLFWIRKNNLRDALTKCSCISCICKLLGTKNHWWKLEPNWVHPNYIHHSARLGPKSRLQWPNRWIDLEIKKSWEIFTRTSATGSEHENCSVGVKLHAWLGIKQIWQISEKLVIKLSEHFLMN